MEGEDFRPPVAVIAEKLVKWHERRAAPKPEKIPRSEEDRDRAIAHIAASWAASSGFGPQVYYFLQHPETPNEQDKDN